MPDDASYPVVVVPEDASSQLEQLGTKSKFWYQNELGQTVLFKEGRPGTGENWAEKVCCEICSALDLPHAHYDFATWRGRVGVITPTIVPERGRLILGNELLASFIKDYDRNQRVRARQHTVRRVIAITSSATIKSPIGWDAPKVIESGADVLVGYLMLDVLVSNQDRHHENWGLIYVPGTGVALAPTFDHASSLGRNETDQARLERLVTKDAGRSVEAYVRRAKTPLYQTPSSARALTTLEAFDEAAKIRPKAAEYWLDKLSNVRQETYTNIFGKVPNELISDTARRFGLKMLEVNTNRLLNREI